MTGKQIYWNKDKEKKWESLCKGQEINFSDWVDKKMEEELKQEMNEDYIQRQLSDISSEIERLSGERNYWLKQLNKSKEIKEATKQEIKTEEIVKEDNELLVRKYAGFIMNYFGLCEEEAMLKGKEALLIHLTEKIDNLEIILLRLAEREKLKFKKVYPWLKKYVEQGQKIEVII